MSSQKQSASVNMPAQPNTSIINAESLGFRFLDLPPEIRVRIYRLLISHEGPLVVPIAAGYEDTDNLDSDIEAVYRKEGLDFSPGILSPLSSCSIIRKEYASVLYSAFILHFGTNDISWFVFHIWTSRISTVTRNAIRALRFDMPEKHFHNMIYNLLRFPNLKTLHICLDRNLSQLDDDENHVRALNKWKGQAKVIVEIICSKLYTRDYTKIDVIEHCHGNWCVAIDQPVYQAIKQCGWEIQGKCVDERFYRTKWSALDAPEESVSADSTE